jgi:E3 SUMO-protein ligase NSE2
MLASNLLRFQQSLANMARDCMTQEEIETFIEEQTKVVKKLAVKNVERERHVKTFVAAVVQVRQQTMDNNDDAADFDFQKAIDAEMEKIEKTAPESQLEINQEKLYIEIMEKLGQHQGPVDDDVAIVETGATQSVNLKCPITGQFMMDAVCNKLCGHSYSKVGILSHMKNSRRNSCECPVPGCANKNVQESQLEADLDMQHAVRREQRRQDHMAQQRARGANNLVDSDEE